jgi:outer membrane protein assembly factor BamB
VTGLVVANGSVYLGAGNMIYCLDDTSGRQCQGWHSYKATSLVTAPVLAYGRIYFGTLDGKVYVLSSQGSLVRLTSHQGADLTRRPGVPARQFCQYRPRDRISATEGVDHVLGVRYRQPVAL